MVLNRAYLRHAQIGRSKGYTMKAKADKKVTITLTGEELNILEHVLRTSDEVGQDAPAVMRLNGKLQNKQAKATQ